MMNFLREKCAKNLPEQMRVVSELVVFEPRVHFLEEFSKVFRDQAPLHDMVRLVLRKEKKRLSEKLRRVTMSHGQLLKGV
jgi:predicted ABC-class ATPase